MKKNFFISLLFLAIGILLCYVSFVYKDFLGQTIFYIILAFSILSIIFGIAKLYSLCSGKTAERQKFKDMPNYRRKSELLSKKEMELYSLLKGIFAKDRFEVLPQVTLLSVIDKLSHTSYRNELFRVIDFCIINSRTSEPLLLIELNDASHNRADRKERDQKVQAICEKAKMPIISFTLQEAQDVNYVKKMINKNIIK